MAEQNIREGIDREALAGLHRVIPTFRNGRESKPIDAYLTSGEINKMLDQILASLNSHNVVRLKDNQELPDNKVWHKVEREFEAYCAGRNDLLGANFKAVEKLEVKDEQA